MRLKFKHCLGRSAACSLAALFGILALQSFSTARADATTRPEIHIVSFDLLSTTTGQPPRHMHKIQTDQGLVFTDNLDGTRQLMNFINGAQMQLDDRHKTAVIQAAPPRPGADSRRAASAKLPTEDQKILKLMQTTAVNSGNAILEGKTVEKWIANDPDKDMGAMALLPTITTIWIYPKTGDVPKVEVQINPNSRFSIQEVYTNFVINPDVPDGTFNFDAPAGYTILASNHVNSRD